MEKCEEYLLAIKNNTESTKNNTALIANILKAVYKLIAGVDYGS